MINYPKTMSQGPVKRNGFEILLPVENRDQDPPAGVLICSCCRKVDCDRIVVP